MALAINRVTNANVYINGANFLGKAEEVKLPDFVWKMSEHMALGMVGTLEFPTGLEKLEAEIKWSSLYEDAIALSANPFNTHQIQIRASQEKYSAAGLDDQIPVVIMMTASFKKTPMGNFKKQDNAEFTSMLSVTACKMEVDGIAIVEADIAANIYKVNGVDILAAYKANTGAA